jgi:hypothetical protein
VLTATQKTFLNGLAIVPKKKIAIGKSKTQKESDALRTAFKNYRRAEGTAIAEIKKLSKRPGMEVSTEGLENRVKKVQAEVQDTQNQDAATATQTLNDATEDMKEIKEEAADDTRFSDKYDDEKLEESRHKPVYEDKVRRIKEERDRLALMPGTGDNVKKLNELLDKGKEEADKNNFGSAYKKLKGLSGAVKNGDKAAQKFRETAGGNKEAQKPLETAEKNLVDYTELADLSDADWIAAQRKAIDAQLKRLETKGVDVKDVAAKLTKIGDGLKDKHSAAQYEATRANGLFDQASQKIYADLTAWAPVNVVEPFRSRLSSAQSMVGAQQYGAGADLLKQLLQDVGPIHESAKKDYEEWVSVEKKLKENCMPGMEKGANIKYPSIQVFANALISIYKSDAHQQVKAHDFKGAAATAQNVVDRYPSLEGAMQRYEHLEGTFLQFEGRFKKQAELAQAAIKQLAKEKGDTAPHEDALTKARSAWNKTIDQLLATDGLTADNIDAAYKIASKEVSDVAKAINDILSDGQALALSKTVAENKDKNQEYNELVLQVQRRLKHLEQDSPSTAVKLQERLDSLLNDAKKGFQEAHLTSLKKIQETVEEAITGQKDRAGNLAGEAEPLAAAVKKDVARLKKKNKDFAAYLDGLSQRADDCLGMTGGKKEKDKTTTDSAGTVVAAAVEELRKLQTEVNDAAKGIADVEKKLKELREKLNDKALKKCAASRRGVLLHKMRNELRASCRGMSPAKALAAPDGPLAGFEEELKAALTAAEDAQKKRDKVVEAADKLLKRLDDELKDASHFKKSVKARLEGAKDPNEGGEASAELDIKAIEQLLEDAQDGDHRMALENKAREDEFNNTEAKKAYEAAADVFEKNDLRTAQEAHDATPRRDRDPGPLQDIKAGYKDVKKTAKQHNYVVANEKLAEIGRQARAYAANPMGARTTARNKLKEVNAKWKQAVAAHVRAIEELKKMIEDEANDLSIDANGVKAAQDQLGRLAALFDAGQFDKTVKIINDEATNLTQLRNAKENGLRYLRRYRELLKKDPMLEYIGPNPFTDYTIEFLEGRLKDLELNLLRA